MSRNLLLHPTDWCFAGSVLGSLDCGSLTPTCLSLSLGPNVPFYKDSSQIELGICPNDFT